MIIYWIISVLILLLLLIVLSKVKVEIVYTFKSKENHLEIKMKALFGLVRIQKKLPSDKQAENGNNGEEKESSHKYTTISDNNDITEDESLKSIMGVNGIIEHIPKLYRIIKKLLKKVQIKHFEWMSTIGTGDAANTGVVAGLGWAIKGSSLGIISNYMTFRTNPIINITPNFQQKISETYLTCMFQLRIGHAIVAGIKLFKYWFTKMRKSKANNHAKVKDLPKEDQSV
ncbi:DUF2953 domain-containing protein [Caldibacillus lycopersici]|uniref:DUF2953 domain-containing protein n=1 Tax=Perspicuibacillus lycopersici TaxID=1325689 RepID=A0AAE3IT90_9BACI|nr:DUF2953 domain-containing protein [Perspicuibacillus lycopersici]MCU9614213.1 DUF2953 domain-containing protein [Perspicuibacillus lycopersici]